MMTLREVVTVGYLHRHIHDAIMLAVLIFYSTNFRTKLLKVCFRKLNVIFQRYFAMEMKIWSHYERLVGNNFSDATSLQN